MNDTQIDRFLKTICSIKTPPTFHSDVWNRIAAESGAEGGLASVRRYVSKMVDFLSQPLGATAAIASFVIAGCMFGLLIRPEKEPPVIQYIQSISPFITHNVR
jgi:hypothetical protein